MTLRGYYGVNMGTCWNYLGIINGMSHRRPGLARLGATTGPTTGPSTGPYLPSNCLVLKRSSDSASGAAVASLGAHHLFKLFECQQLNSVSCLHQGSSRPKPPIYKPPYKPLTPISIFSHFCLILDAPFSPPSPPRWFREQATSIKTLKNGNALTQQLGTYLPAFTLFSLFLLGQIAVRNNQKESQLPNIGCYILIYPIGFFILF